MAYNAVPTVATGDPWTAANHNTYIRDNFAAGVPDIFTTKGDLAVASAANAAGRLGVGSNNQVLMADSAQSLGVKWGNNVVLFTDVKTNASWSGSSKSVADYDITANSFNSDIPTSAKGILAFITAKWSVAGSGYNINLRTKGAVNPIIYIRNDTTYYLEKQAIIPLDASGVFTVKVEAATCDYVKIHILGYLL